MADLNLLSDTEIYKNTYHQLVCWVKELHWMVQWQKSLNIHNTELQYHRTVSKLYAERITELQKRIMKLEFDLGRYSTIMVEDKQETIMKDFSIQEAELVSNEEFQRRRSKRGGGTSNGDWLSGMEWGTQIFVRMKVGQREPWMLVKFLYAGKKQKVCFLVPMMGDEQVVGDDRQWLPVDPDKFCKTWELYDSIPPLPIEKEGIDDPV